MFRNLGFIVLVLLFYSCLLFSQSNDTNCFTLLVGKNASIDGSVLLAHNEDDYGRNLVNWYKVPKQHHDNDTIELIDGGKIEQISETAEFLWLEMPGMKFSDSYINEFGVTIVSNACRSKENSAELVDGGIGYYLRRIMAERAISSKHAVKIAGAIIDSIGYASSGRTYCIADPNESWMISIVKGKHWIAQRIPDDHIAILPNYYTIQEIDLADTLNFLGSEDIVEYSIERDWYNPETDGEFIFRDAYGNNSSIESMGNIARHWGAINLLLNQQYELSDTFPFSFAPKGKISIQELMDILEYHYEDTNLDVQNGESPHNQKLIQNSDALPICRKDTQYGMIAQLRSWLPADIGNVLWIAPYRPCSQVFIPWYFGISEIPSSFAIGDYNFALQNQFNNKLIEESEAHIFWNYVTFSDRINNNYYDQIVDITRKKDSTQQYIFDHFIIFDEVINNIYQIDNDKVDENLNLFIRKMFDISLDYLK